MIASAHYSLLLHTSRHPGALKTLSEKNLIRMELLQYRLTTPSILKTLRFFWKREEVIKNNFSKPRIVLRNGQKIKFYEGTINLYDGISNLISLNTLELFKKWKLWTLVSLLSSHNAPVELTFLQLADWISLSGFQWVHRSSLLIEKQRCGWTSLLRLQKVVKNGGLHRFHWKFHISR